MTPEAAIHAALIGRAQTLPFTLLFPSTGGAEPSGEYVEIRHLPAANDRITLANGQTFQRRGILQATLCSPPGKHEITYIEKAGTIAAAFTAPLPPVDGVRVAILRADMAQGFADGQHWRVPVSVYYQAVA